MFEKKDHIVFLIDKHFRNDLTPEQKIELEEWLSESEAHRKLLAQFSDSKIMEEKLNLYLDSEIPDLWTKVQQRMNGIQPILKKENKFSTKIYWKAAAVATGVFTLAVGIYIGWKINTPTPNRQTRTPTELAKRNTPHIINDAELTLSNGKKLAMQNEKDGPIENQGVYEVFKHKNDLYYKVSKVNVPTDKNLHNTLTTPRGGQYRIIFEDNSTINMNVASSLTFNVSSPVRELNLKGEAQFNIAHRSNDKFLVMLPPAKDNGRKGKVEVTGTRFNINAYEDDTDKKVTLLEGNINVSTVPQTYKYSSAVYIEKEKVKKLSMVGDQAQIQENGAINITHKVDTLAVISWKDLVVNFDEASTRKVLSTLEQWYDVKVIYKTQKVPECFFTGKITPETEIETVLEIMEFQCDALKLTFDTKKREITVVDKD